MPLWGEIMIGGGSAVAAGLVLLYGFSRNWFSSVYTSTIEGGEGFMVAGLLMVAAGAVALITGIATAF